MKTKCSTSGIFTRRKSGRNWAERTHNSFKFFRTDIAGGIGPS